jgi:hypothetical protein
MVVLLSGSGDGELLKQRLLVVWKPRSDSLLKCCFPASDPNGTYLKGTSKNWQPLLSPGEGEDEGIFRGALKATV